jgi:hypothetical protein
MAMKKNNYVILFVLLLVTLTACAAAGPQPAGGAINPGDRVGDFLVTNQGGEDVTYLWQMDTGCTQQTNPAINSCKLNTDKKVNVSLGVYAPVPGKIVEQRWAEHTYEMTINGRPVNLKAFGFVDVVHPRVGPMRLWNVVLIASQPGEITVHAQGTVDGDPFEDTTSLTFMSAP